MSGLRNYQAGTYTDSAAFAWQIYSIYRVTKTRLPCRIPSEPRWLWRKLKFMRLRDEKEKKREREKRIDYSRGALTCEQQPGYIISTRNNVAGNSFEIPVRKNSIIDTRKEKRKTRHQGKRITKIDGGHQHAIVRPPRQNFCSPRSVQIKRKDVIKTSVCVTNWITTTEAWNVGEGGKKNK